MPEAGDAPLIPRPERSIQHERRIVVAKTGERKAKKPPSGDRIRDQLSHVEFLGSFPDDPPVVGLPEIAFVGRSNVGKSSALNCLLGRKAAARVSRTPGRTQLVNLFRIGKTDDNAVSFADLPGYGFAKVPPEVRNSWKKMIDRYLTMRADLRLVVVLVDARLPPQELDGVMIDALAEIDLPTLVIATKVDKLTRNERHAALAAIIEGFDLPEDALVPFSSVSGEGRDEVWDRLEAVCG
jgi:GTP-binding protein